MILSFQCLVEEGGAGQGGSPCPPGGACHYM